MVLARIYYFIKPLIPRNLQIFLRRQIILRKRFLYSNIWPIDETACRSSDDWPGWPEQKKFALVLTHDVDTALGHEKSHSLMALEKELGFRSSFNFVPERYEVSSALRRELQENGFEVGVHGLKHDGKLYRTKKVFTRRAVKINKYLEDWNAVGFRSPAMHHNLKWIHELNIEYDASTFDTDPFEPQSDGVNTIFPFWVKGNSDKNGYVELPYTIPQDSTLFILMKEKDIAIWKEKLDWIVKKGGMALLNVHPDYINFENRNFSIEEYSVKFYEDFLDYIKIKYEGDYWHILPKEISCFWRENVLKLNST